MSFWEPCWACRVVRGEAAAGVVTQGPDVIVAINPFPLAAGHALVMPCRHIPDIYDLPGDLAGPVLAMAARIARAARQAFRADGVTLRQNNGAASDQHLFHFHLHVIPRFDGDAARFVRSPAWIPEQEQQTMAAELAQMLSRAT